MPPSWHPVPACSARLCCRLANPILATTAAGGLFSMRRRRMESDAESAVATTVAGETILYRHNDCAASIRKSRLEIKNRCTKDGVNREKLASIPKSGPEIKNRCTPRAKSREKLAAIPNSDSRIKNRCSKGHQNSHRLKGHQNILQPKTISPSPSAQDHQSSSGNGTGLPSAGLKGIGLPHSLSLSERIVASSAHF